MKGQAGSVGGGGSRTFRPQKPERATAPKKAAAKSKYKLRKQSNSDTRGAKKK